MTPDAITIRHAISKLTRDDYPRTAMDALSRMEKRYGEGYLKGVTDALSIVENVRGEEWISDKIRELLTRAQQDEICHRIS